MTIQEAIDADLCIRVNSKDEAQRLLPHLRGDGGLDFKFPLYAYSPRSVTHPSGVGLGFQSDPEWLGRSLQVVNLEDLEN